MAWEAPHRWEHNCATHWANHTDHMLLRHGPLYGGSGSPSGPPDGHSAGLVSVGMLGEVEQRPLPRDCPLWAWCREHGDR